MEEYDVLVKDVSIIEGSGKSLFKSTIGILDDKIISINDKPKGDAKYTIDASKLLAVPGFIDSHGHGELTVLFYPQCESYVMQGVTTFIGGNCGQSWAPLGDLVPIFDLARAENKEILDELIYYKYYPDKKLFPKK